MRYSDDEQRQMDIKSGEELDRRASRDAKPAEEYLYDGVYASFDGFQIKLRVERDNGDHIIYLEPRAWDDLLRFVKRIGWVDSDK